MARDSYEELNEEMLKRLLKANPEIGTVMGLHDPYDWYWSNGGFARVDETHKLIVQWSKEAHAIAKKTRLNADQKISLKLLDHTIGMSEFLIKDYPFWKMYPDILEGIGGVLFMMVSRDYAPFEARMDAINSRIEKLPALLSEFRTRFDGSGSVKLWVNVAIGTCEQIPGFLRFIESIAKDKVSDQLHKKMQKNMATAELALKDHREWLVKMLTWPDIEYAMGKRKFAKLIELRGLGMTPAEMLALGEKLLKEFKEERERVAERIAPGAGVEGAAKVVKQDSPRTFEEALKMTEEEMLKAKRFIIRNRLGTIDESAVLRVVETPEFLAPILPFAALFPPFRFDKVQEGNYVVTRPKESKDLASHLNRAAIINTAVHEAYPGHFHQGVRTNAKPWTLQLNYIAGGEGIGSGYETIEGWAHYCEKMMYDHGHEQTDPAAFEMLNGAIWRAYRIIADIKLAHGDATVEEMVEMGVDETGMPRNAMESEVRRYTRSPSQALSYMVGRHQILEFRKKMEKKLGRDFDERRFHDLIAEYGCLPIGLLKEAVRSGMKG